TIGTVWIGIRPYYKGFIQFEEKWELDDGLHYTDTTVQVDANASGGALAQVSFTTDSTLVKRVSIRVSDVVLSGTEAWKGRYQILLRYRSTSASACTFGIQLKSGWANGSNFAPQEEV